MMQTAKADNLQRFAGSAAIAVIGVGCLFPDAESTAEYWENIQRGHDAIGPIPMTHWKPEDYFDSDPKRPDHTYAKTGGFLKPFAFDPLKYGLAPHALEATDTTQLLGMVAAHQALVDAGYGPERAFDRNRVSCLLGVTGTLELVIPLGARLGHPIWKKALAHAGVSDAVAQEVMEEVARAYVPWQENSFPGLLGNVVAGRIANRFDLGGSNSVVDAACASSLAALHMAMMELETGRADMVISGGMDTFNDIFMYMCFSKTPALSPTGQARPFDAQGDGTILGEGLGAVILKRLDDAVRDGDRIYAVLRGMGSASDGKGQAIYAPVAAGQVKALERAYQRSGVSPSTIGLLEAHGTGTKVGDGVELEALKTVYGQVPETGAYCQLGSVKSQIGHTKAAAGAAGLIKAVMALYHKVLPPTLKVAEPHPKLKDTPFLLDDKARPWIALDGPRRAAVSAFGFGGSNYHCVLEEYEAQKTSTSWDPELSLALFSADNPEALAIQLKDAAAHWALRHDRASLQRQWRQKFSTQANCRLGLIARGERSFSELLEACHKRLLTTDGPWPKGSFYENSPREGALAFVFAGQGSQTPGMLRELACRFPEFHESLTFGEALLRAEEGSQVSLRDLIYPTRAFKEEQKQAQLKSLTETRYAQLALGTLGLGAVKTLKRFGVQAQLYAGHSYGELLALYAAGAWTEDQLLAASYARGRWMSEKALPGGTMLAVMAPSERIEAWLKSTELDVQVANRNAPDQWVLGGSIEAIEAAQRELKAQKISCKRLEVSSAFHTRFVREAVPYFRGALEGLPIGPLQKPVFSNTTAGLYPDDAQAKRELLASQLGASVAFADMIAAMQEQGLGTVVEIGPGRKLQGLLKSCVAKDTRVLSLDGAEDSYAGLAQLLLQLSVLGYSVDWQQWTPGPSQWAAPKASFQVPISGANYRSPVTAAPSKVKAPQAIEIKKDIKAPEAAPHLAEKPAISTQQAAKPLVKPSGVSSVTQRDDLHRLEKLLQDMQDLQRRTTEAHTLFLENQRQFQSMLRSVLVSDHEPLSSRTAELSSPQFSRPAPEPFPAQQSAREPHSLSPSKHVATPEPELRSRPVPTAQAPVPAPKPPVLEPSMPKAAAPATAAVGADIRSKVLGILGQTTGYPSELLKEDMALEADLGIDSIKKVEIFSQLQAEFVHLAADPSATQAAQTIADLLSLCAHHEAASPPSSVSQESERVGAWSAGTVAFAASEPTYPDAAILQLIADKTGFPREMLQPAMDLEADLGIDSIKKVEIFSGLQERFPQLSQQGAEALHHSRTIADLQALLATPSSPAGVVSSSAEIAASPGLPLESAGHADHAEIILAQIAERTGYPREVLQLEMDLEGDLGIDSIKRVEIIAALGEKLAVFQNAGQDQLAHVKTLGDLVRLSQTEDHVAAELLKPEVSADWDLSEKKKESRPRHPLLALDTWTLEARPWTPQGPRCSLRKDAEVWIVDDGSNLARNIMLKLQERGVQARLLSLAMQEKVAVTEQLQGLFLLAPTKFDVHAHRWYVQALRLLRRVGPQLQSLHDAFVVSVSRHGGQFGLDGLTQMQQVQASGVAALTKTVAQEWPAVHTRAIDLAKDFVDGFEAAHRCIDGALWAGPLEIGIASQQQWSLELQLQRAEKEWQAPKLEIKPKSLILVTGGARGVTAASLLPLAERYQPHFVIWGRTPLAERDLSTWDHLGDAAAVKRALMEQDPALKHPRALEQAYRLLLQQKEIHENLQSLRALGAEVSYRVVDVSKEAELREAADALVKDWGVPAGVIHGAGVIRDKLIGEQKDEELLEVLDTKLRLLPHLEQWTKAGLEWVVLFSSSTARLGRKGQLAYGVANEILNKCAQYLRSQGLTALALNWGPWDGGMVQDSLKKVFAAEGIGTIPLAAGADFMCKALEYRGLGASEWVILAAKELRAEETEQAELQEPLGGALTLSLATCPVLIDHVLKHRAVVPAALILEWLSVQAQRSLPDLHLAAVEEFTLWKGIVLDADQQRLVAVKNLDISEAESSGKRIRCDLISTDPADSGRAYARAQFVFRPELARDLGNEGFKQSADQQFAGLRLYDEVLFHGESLAYLTQILSADARSLEIQAELKGQPQLWSQQGLAQDWILGAPLWDAVFQAAIVWSHTQLGLKCLPNRLQGLELTQSLPKAGPVVLKLSLVHQEAHALRFSVKVLDPKGAVCAQGGVIEMVMDASLAHSFADNHLPSGARASLT